MTVRRAAPGVVGCMVLVVATAHAAPRDFTAEVHAMATAVACTDAAPPEFDKQVVAAHCKQLGKTIGLWQTQWRDKASPFFSELLKAGYPSAVVYPFGGGDVATMLAVYPDATEYTSLSLEGMGDPRPMLDLAKHPQKLSDSLLKLRTVLVANLGWSWNTTNQLSIDSSGTGAGLPNILAIALVHLAANGYEPTEARFFDLAADGTLVYLTQDRIDAWDAEHAKPRVMKVKTNKEVQQGIFNDIEIVFRKKGDPKAPKKIFRHIAADLSDAGIDANHGAYAYLDGKRDFAAITKASSYLFWKPIEFDKIRAVFLARMKLMVSDDTGMPPHAAGPAGFTQKVYGSYAGAYFKFADKDVGKEMVELWKSSLSPTVSFRFGYYDIRRKPHVMFTYK